MLKLMGKTKFTLKIYLNLWFMHFLGNHYIRGTEAMKSSPRYLNNLFIIAYPYIEINSEPDRSNRKTR